MALVGTSAPWQQVPMPALDLRRMMACLIASEGVAGQADMKVSQRAAGANMTVDIAAGEAVVQGDQVTNQGFYWALNDAVFNLTGFTAAHASLPRIDRVVLRIRDAFHGDAANDVSFQIKTGTATSGATLANCTGALAPGNNEFLLANVLIPAAATTITDANIDTTGAQNNSPAVRPVYVPAGNIFPSGAVTEFAGATAPAGWLLCDGAAVSRTTYAALFNAISTTYGVGDGSTTFNLPDLRGRVAVGKGTHAEVDALADSDGLAVGSRKVSHAHAAGTTTLDPTDASSGTFAWQATSSSADAGSAFLVVNYIIKT